MMKTRSEVPWCPRETFLDRYSLPLATSPCPKARWDTGSIEVKMPTNLLPRISHDPTRSGSPSYSVSNSMLNLNQQKKALTMSTSHSWVRSASANHPLENSFSVAGLENLALALLSPILLNSLLFLTLLHLFPPILLIPFLILVFPLFLLFLFPLLLSSSFSPNFSSSTVVSSISLNRDFFPLDFLADWTTSVFEPDFDGVDFLFTMIFGRAALAEASRVGIPSIIVTSTLLSPTSMDRLKARGTSSVYNIESRALLSLLVGLSESLLLRDVVDVVVYQILTLSSSDI